MNFGSFIANFEIYEYVDSSTIAKSVNIDVICLPVRLVDGVDDEHDGAGGAEEEGDDGDDADVTVRAIKSQVEDDKGDTAVLN